MSPRRRDWPVAACAAVAVLGVTALTPTSSVSTAAMSTAAISTATISTATMSQAASTTAAQTLPVPEPPALGYIPPFAPATAPPATDIKPRPGVSALGSGASLYPCPSYGGIDRTNPAPAAGAGIYSWGPFAPVQVGDGFGNVNWKLNPYQNASWYMYLHSLRWLGQAINAGVAGDPAALDQVRAVARDWIADNPYPWTSDIGAYESTMHRTNVLLCLREAIVGTAPDGLLPVGDAWLDSALLTHAAFLRNYWSGPGFNHGTMQSIALLGVGCVLGRLDLRDLAISRLSQAITTAIDTQGASNEQSTGYAWYNYVLWGLAEQALTTCNISTGTTIADRRRLLVAFVAQSTNPLGKPAQIGDTAVVNTVPVAGSDTEWAGSQGTMGTAPTVRVSQYKAGYVFGRSGWGTGARPFGLESFYSLHLGPGRATHGHQDHTSVTYVARGRDILIDGGFPGYAHNKWRTWALSDYAHNVMTVPTATPLTAAATKLSRYAYGRGAEFFEMTDQPYVGVGRVRAVLALHDPDFLVVLDRGSATRAQQWQTLWHLPSDQVASVHSRTTAIVTKPGDASSTILFQVPFKQALPPGAILTLRGLTIPRVQGWHYPVAFDRRIATALMFARSAPSATILSVIVPTRTGSGVGYTLTPAAGGWTNLDLRVGGVRGRVRISPGNALLRG